MYLASIVDKATIHCFLLIQLIDHPNDCTSKQFEYITTGQPSTVNLSILVGVDKTMYSDVLKIFMIADSKICRTM